MTDIGREISKGVAGTQGAFRVRRLLDRMNVHVEHAGVGRAAALVRLQGSLQHCDSFECVRTRSPGRL